MSAMPISGTRWTICAPSCCRANGTGRSSMHAPPLLEPEGRSAMAEIPDDEAEGAHTDFTASMSYGDYLKLDPLLACQQPVSDQHDEMLFIVIHQATELWLKRAIHELKATSPGWSATTSSRPSRTWRGCRASKAS